MIIFIRLQNKISYTLLFFLLCLNQLSSQKYEPENGKCLVFIGQDLTAVGGLNDYNDGYTDYFDTPAGVTTYTNLSPSTNSYGYINKGLDGLLFKANWGAGDTWADIYLQDSTYQHCAIAIGLSFVNHEKKVAKGQHDHLIKDLAKWIKTSNRPIFLRIGYEFDGWEWNHYNKKYYLKAWKRIYAIFKNLEINNVAFVWQSKGYGSNQKILEKWYPGDRYVDWVGYSFFGNPDQEMLTFARKHHKPVFISEATPIRQTGSLIYNSDFKNKNLEKQIWKDWFEPFFHTIESNSDVIKAFSYIHNDWSSQPMWMTNQIFNQTDARIQMSPYISKKWKEKLNKNCYILAHHHSFHN